MMMDLDPVVIDDDDNDVIIQNDSNYGNHSNKSRMDMIVIDDVEDLTQNTVTDIIEIDDEPDLRNKTNQLLYLCDRIYRENKHLKKFVEICLDLENTDGMLRIINRTLLRGYRDTTKTFKKSPELDKTMKKAINLIETDPEHKFSHVKFVCEVFKKHKFRKKVDFLTLTPLLKGSVENKLKPNTIVDVDSPITFEVPIINLEEDENRLINIIDKSMTAEVILEIENENSNKENHIISDETETNLSEVNKNIVDTTNKTKNSVNTVKSKNDKHSIPNSNSLEQGKGDVPNQLLVPQRDEEYESHVFDSNVIEQVKEIENEIAFYKDKIAQLEEEEVLENTVNSPYLKCDKMKALITKLYKKLCILTGENPVKRYEVRLNVADGHPPGPVRKLENFINNNIGSNGEPPFPDFTDVMNCVCKANHEEKLGWKAPQIMREANLLFVQCGRALQKRRQRREWRDMLGHVNQKKLDYDPADEDPELQARLELNKRIALGNEADLLERFAKMEDEKSKSKISNPNLTLENDSDYNSENEDQEPNKGLQQAPSIYKDLQQTLNIYKDLQQPPGMYKAHNNTADPQKTNETVSCFIYTHRVNKDCSNKTNNSQKPMELINDLAKTAVKSEFCDNNNVLEINKPTVNSEITKEDINMSTDEDSVLTNNITNALDTPVLESTETEDKDKIKIKQEPEDVAKLLEELGNNYTWSIFDIEDPFLVIEISSDSSDGETDSDYES